jgi:hypothetical protein
LDAGVGDTCRLILRQAKRRFMQRVSAALSAGDARTLAHAFCSLDVFPTPEGHNADVVNLNGTTDGAGAPEASHESVARSVAFLVLDGAAPRNQPIASKRARVL